MSSVPQLLYIIQIHNDDSLREEDAIATMQTDVVPASFVVGNSLALYQPDGFCEYKIDRIQHEATISNEKTLMQNRVRVYVTPLQSK